MVIVLCPWALSTIFLYDASSRVFSRFKRKILREKSPFIFHIAALALENSKVVEEIWKKHLMNNGGYGGEMAMEYAGPIKSS